MKSNTRIPIFMIKFFNILFVFLLFIIWFPNCANANLNVAADAYKWDGHTFILPLRIRDNSGVNRDKWPVTTGVPLPFALVDKLDQLRLTNKNGQTIPCQFGVLSKYWARDKSLKWVLLDFQITLSAKSTAFVYLRNDASQLINHKTMITEENEQMIKIDTGPLQVSISKKNCSLFEKVDIKGRTILKALNHDGPKLISGKVESFEHFQGKRWNYNGWPKTKTFKNIDVKESVYTGKLKSSENVYVETCGPLRCVIVVKGRYMPQESGKGIVKEGMYNFTTRLHFFKGHSFIKVEHAIENSDTKQPLWNYMFREASLSHSLFLDKKAVISGGGIDFSQKKVTGFVSTSKNETGWLYQNPGWMEGKKKKTRYKGSFKIGLSENGIIESPAVKGFSGRFLDISDKEKGIAVSIRYFEEEGPRAISMSPKHLELMFNADRPGRIISSEPGRPEYDLDFGERIISDMLFYFHEKSAVKADVFDIVEAFNYPLFAYAPTEWYSDTEAWYFEISRNPGIIKHEKNVTGHWQPDTVGYKNHGENGGYNAGGHHESLNSGWLSFLRTGDLVEFEKNLALSRWSIAHNPGWAYRNNVLAFGKGENKYKAIDNLFVKWDKVSGFRKKDFYLWREDNSGRGIGKSNNGGSTYLNKFKWLPDIEHYALFRLFEYYYLTGDRRALDSINGFVNWGLYIQHRYMFKGMVPSLAEIDYFKKNPDALHRGYPNSRVFAWMLYTNIAGLHATGSPVYNEFACWQIRRMLALLRHRHGQLKGWWKEPQVITANEPPGYFSTTQTWQEAIGVLALHEAYKTYGDERILDGIWALADYFSHHVIFYPHLGMVNKWTSMPNSPLGNDSVRTKSLFPQRHDRHVQMWPILYHYTGWQEVYDRYMIFESKRKDSWIRDWFLQTIDWQKQNKHKKSMSPPDPIKDLKILKHDQTGITLTWTSPKDDGPEGKASKYFIKYSNKPIVEFAPTDNPDRSINKKRIVEEVENYVLDNVSDKNLKRLKQIQIKQTIINREDNTINRWNTNWHRVNAFWMAEHVSGEPEPQRSGEKEVFRIEKLNPHNWFGSPNQPGIEILKPGTYYFAICSWDEDFNLSKLSNVVELKMLKE